jgi:hypothetical protein
MLVDNRWRQCVYLSDQDVRTLRLLVERDFMVRLEGRGLPPYHARAQALLKRLAPLPDKALWYVPTSLKGPLRPAAPPRPPDTSE